jgi:TolA-binding protein
VYLGRSFYQKGYYSQAADTFSEALKTHEIHDDDLGKELYYWLGRAQEAEAKKDEALKTYGQIIQWDYNFRDVRKRIDDLRG